MCHTNCLESLASLCRLWAPLMLFLGEGLRMPCNLQSLIPGCVYAHVCHEYYSPYLKMWTRRFLGTFLDICSLWVRQGPCNRHFSRVSSDDSEGRDGYGTAYPPFTSTLLLYSVSRLKLPSLPSTSAQPGWLTQVVC